MDKKRSVGVTIISLVILISNIITFYINYLGPECLLRAGRLFSVAAVSATASYWYIAPSWQYVFSSPEHYIPLLWSILMSLCAIGIFTLNRFARILFIWASAGYIILTVIARLMMPWQMSMTPGAFLFDSFLALVFPIIYIIFLTRPRVKEMFK